MNTGTIEYADCEHSHVFRLVGDMRHTGGSSLQHSAALDAFIDRHRAEGALKSVLVDLRETTAIDSTHLGLLVRLGELSGGAPARLVSNRPAINKLLHTMGLHTVFDLTDNPAALDAVLGCASTDLLPAAEKTRDSRDVLLGAHRALAGLSPENHAAFENLITLLTQEKVDKPRTDY